MSDEDPSNNNNNDKKKKMKADVKKPKPRPKPCDYTDDDVVSKLRRIESGTILASNKPSYCFKLGIHCSSSSGETIQSKHTKSLRNLLKILVRGHNWAEASGVLSVLLKATPKDKSIHHNRFKYWATLELMKHIKGEDAMKSTKFQIIYELWMKKCGSMKNRSLKDRFAIQLEFILFCLSQGNLEDAHQAAFCIMQERGFESDGISNLVVGLTFYELWYSGLPKEWKLTTHQFNMSSIDHENTSAWYDDDDIAAVEESHHHINFPLQTNSITSVANYKFFHHNDDMEVDSANHLHNKHFYLDSAQATHVGHDLPHASIFNTNGLPPLLLPLRLPPKNIDNLDDFIRMYKNFQNDHYKSAVKHLRQALHSTPPVVEALHPLIQMLLLGDSVNEALDELENFFSDSNKALKLRLKVGLLENFDRTNYLKLSACYEDILEVDPTCEHSLTTLIIMHRRGDYNTEKLVKMICLHLDATCEVEWNIWKELASCLLKLSRCAGDDVSICLNAGDDGSNFPSYSAHDVNQNIPELFTSGDDWRLRCRWWLNRHFSPRILASEVAAGDLQLLTWKAATATFLYGRDFRYVIKVVDLLKKQDMDMYSSLRMHIHNSVGFYHAKYNMNI